jgi:transcriptional regulator with XRE-family HTH domain
MNAGERLRALRESLGLTMRDVESASALLAAKRENPAFAFSLSRLSEIESKNIHPSIFKLYTLSVLYRRDFRELLSWYGVDLSQAGADMSLISVPLSHRSTAMAAPVAVPLPVRFDPGFDPRKTGNLGRMLVKWGLVPLAHLEQFANDSYTYVYIGSEDLTMYPILLPGAFVQVDETRNKVVTRLWRSEYERPIYCVETRQGITCCWCELNGESLILKPHPLSPVRTRTLRNEREAEVVGQVVGIAMHLADLLDGDAVREAKASPKLT